MHKSTLLIVAISLLFVPSCSKGGRTLGYPTPAETAASSLAQRVMGKAAAKQIVFKEFDSKADSFYVKACNSRIEISGNNANSMAVGLNQYLRTFCNVSFGWFKEDCIKLPKRLPMPTEPFGMAARVDKRFFLNYCTSGYTMPWWKWEDWEHFIDWMALNGVNLPLSVTGQEAIWYEVWTELGLTDEDVRGYFTGPAHLPWHRMLNIDHWGGPLPKSWLEGQKELQKKIVSRERELSMTPVLPAFAGHVPADLQRVHPEAKLTRLSNWGGFSGDYIPSFLDPMDPLFPQIQKSFIEKQTAIYGSDHIYGIDVFNEMTPPSWEPSYLASAGKRVYDALAAADPEAVWLQMGWLFHYQRGDWTPERVKAYLTSYPASQSILLDYYCEENEVWKNTESFYGAPFVWCYLGNFGGNSMLHGNLFGAGERFENALSKAGDNLTGIGCTLEALDCNPFAYEYILSKAWNNWTADEFAASIASCRTGVEADSTLTAAWKDFFTTIYSGGNSWYRDPILVHRPATNSARGHFDGSATAQYNNAALEGFIRTLLAQKGSGRAYQYDLINVTRQWLCNVSNGIYFEYRDALRSLSAPDADTTAIKAAMKGHSERFIGLLDELDEFLSYEPSFLFGKWVSDARYWGADAAEADYFESNARNLVTTWGDRATTLNDYACRTQNGLISGFYKTRWELFFAGIEAGTDNLEQIYDFEKDFWLSGREKYPATAKPISLPKLKATIQGLLTKYGTNN